MKSMKSLWCAGTALAMALNLAPAWAQADDASPAGEADSSDGKDIIVTGSRIQRSGFDAPTPTTIIGETDLRLGNRVSVAQVLNDQPQFRATSTPATTVGRTDVGVSTADLRGLNAVRTLTLLNGHRFTGSNDLNIVPQSLIKRVDVVTGGASAAYGSGAVAGVVNIILDDKMTGFRIGAQSGISSRSDGVRYGGDIAWGTNFAGGRGHFMIAGEYLREKGITDRRERPNLEAGVFQRGDGSLVLAQDVNSRALNRGGAILKLPSDPRLSPVPTDLIFNPDGSIGPLGVGSESFGLFTRGGRGQNQLDYVAVSTPYQRGNIYARASFEVTDSLKLWADASFSRTWGNYGLFPETSAVVIRPDNAFLTQGARDQLASAGINGAFAVGRILDDVGPDRMATYKFSRRNLEGSIGLEGSFGDGWGYSAYYDHGELRLTGGLNNQRIAARFNNAVDSVLVNGVATCRINADANAANNDPACAPINLFGNGNISDAARNYAFGGSKLAYTIKLDTAGANLHGQPFKTWAGPVDIAVGADFRWEEQVNHYVDPLSLANAFATLNSAATSGGFSVKEVFGEVNVPLLDIEDTAHLEINGAARYSDYSTSGGIWTWKTGGTLKLVNDLLLRAVYSRDIRSPSITEYFLARSTGIGTVFDPFLNVQQGQVMVFAGGNPNLTPEISHTLTLGGSYSPHYVPGLRLSVDYYDIKIDNVITTVSVQDTLTQCYRATPGDASCGGVVNRRADGTIESIFGAFRNLASYSTRGLDIEASYRMALGNGRLGVRVLANHVFDLIINDGIRKTNTAGVVGGDTAFSLPKWRVTGSMSYETEDFGVDLRGRYVSGGLYSKQLPVLNNQIGSRFYVDLGVQFKVGQEYTLFANVNNLFDVNPPLTPYATPNYDVIGRYFSAGVKLKF